jgi:hypothetical protein
MGGAAPRAFPDMLPDEVPGPSTSFETRPLSPT